jgi:hypothetical protein
MPSAEELTRSYARDGHPLGRAINLEERTQLIDGLRERLRRTAHELDLSPKSLQRLDRYLTLHYQSLQATAHPTSQEETLQLVRQIAAYFGQVLVMHAGGQWQIGNSLWGTEIKIERLVEVHKGLVVHQHNKTTYSLGNIASGVWDALAAGKKPRLYRFYLEATARHVTERLK